MQFQDAVADVTAKPQGVRRAAALAWAQQIAMVEDRSSPLKDLLGLTEVPRADVSNLCQTTRAFNVLHTHHLTETVALIECSVPDLWALRQCGVQTVVDIVQALLIAIVRAPATAQVFPAEPAVTSRRGTNLGVDTMEGALRAKPGARVPSVINEWVGSLGERDLVIARHRIFLRDRTLEDLGYRCGVSRQRVRQIEWSVLKRLTDWRETGGPTEALQELGLAISKAVAAVMSEQRLLSEIPDLAAPLPALGCRVVDILPALLPDIARQAGWVAVRPLADLRDETFAATLPSGELADTADAADEVEDIRQRLGLTADEWPQWLEYCGLRIFSGTVVRVGAAIPELAVAVLRASGQGMSAEEITTKLGAESVQSVRARLLDDARIVRLGPNLYGLPEWGIETYEGIREEIVQRIDRAGGRVRMSQLVEGLVNQFGVSPRTIQAYASGREFVRTRGWVLLAGDQSTRADRLARRLDTPAATRRCFFRAGRWWFRVDVGTDALRGSGFAAPVGVMRLFQVAEGTERTFDANGVAVRVSWTRRRPAVGSVRGLLLALQARIGDALWLTPASSDRVVTRLAHRPGTRARDLLAHLLGTEAAEDLDVLRQSVAEALGLPRNKPWSALAQALRGRGDLDAAELVQDIIPGEEQTTPTLDQFLSALRGR